MINLIELRRKLKNDKPLLKSQLPPDMYSVNNVGRTYIPVMKIRMKLDVPIQPPPKYDFTAINDDPTDMYMGELPESFSWNRYRDVRTYRPKLPFPIIMEPGYQGTCNSCYAWAIANSLSDQVAILTGENPNLGPSYLLSCTQSPECQSTLVRGCNRGFIEPAAEFMTENAGAVSDSCMDYDEWCCAKNSSDMNALNTLIKEKIPFKKIKDKCINAPSEDIQVYKIMKNTVTREYHVTNIKKHILDHGPVPVYMSLYQDFIAGADPEITEGEGVWKKTGGIYVHLTAYNYDGVVKSVKGDVPPYDYGGNDNDMYKYLGAHAMTIIGWGTKKVKNFLPKAIPNKKKIDLQYWIVRNTWSDGWGDEGYAKIAIPNYTTGVNTTIGMDRYADEFKMYGGVTSFIVDDDTIPEDIIPPTPPPHRRPKKPRKLTASDSTLKGLNSSHTLVFIIVLVVLALIALAVFYKYM